MQQKVRHTVTRNDSIVARKDLWKQHIPASIQLKYEVHNVNHAAEILSQAHPEELDEIAKALDNFWICKNDILTGGGSESAMPKKLTETLQPLGWKETRILVISLQG